MWSTCRFSNSCVMSGRTSKFRVWHIVSGFARLCIFQPPMNNLGLCQLKLGCLPVVSLVCLCWLMNPLPRHLFTPANVGTFLSKEHMAAIQPKIAGNWFLWFEDVVMLFPSLQAKDRCSTDVWSQLRAIHAANVWFRQRTILSKVPQHLAAHVNPRTLIEGPSAILNSH